MLRRMFNTTWLRDTVERVVRTFLQAWLGAWIVIQDVTADKLFNSDVLTVGLVAAVGAFLLSLGAASVGSRDSASFQS